jgi:Ca-activated chloride channel family protein
VEFGIKVYTIGLGTNGTAVSPIGILPNGQFQYGNMPVQIDEDLLKEIANITGGEYFRAVSTTRLGEIYEQINKLEKTEIEEFKFKSYDEKFRPLVLLALGLLAIELLLRYTLFKSFV